MVTLFIWLGWCLLVFSTVKLLFSTLFRLQPLEGSTQHTCQEWVIILPFLRVKHLVKYLCKLFLITLHGWFVCSPPLCINHLFIPIWIHGYLFYTLGNNPIQFYLSVDQRLILCVFCPSLTISHFSKEPSFSLFENSTRHQDLDTRFARC